MILGEHLTTFAIDGDYNNQLTNPYTADTGAGPAPLNHRSDRVVVWKRCEVTGTQYGILDIRGLRRRDFVAVIFPHSLL